jgi:ketosteroid isomerase-like protein
MSEQPASQNVDIVRRAFEAFNSEDIERIIALTHVDFEAVVPPELSPEPDTYRGHDGMRRYFQSFQDVMDEIRFRPQRFWEVGPSVVASLTLSARGRRTAIPVTQRIAQVWTIRDGRALRVRTYPSLAEALEAVGLSQ